VAVGYLLGRIAKYRFARTFARWVIPPRVRRKISASFEKRTEKPTVDDFRRILSEKTATAIVPGRVVMVCGSLQPGGAERQLANTLVGLAGSSLESVTLLCDCLQPDTKQNFDFYLPLAQSSGAAIRVIKTSWGAFDRLLLPRSLKAALFHPNLIADVANLYLEFRTLRPEIVHAWLDWSNVRAGLAAVLAGVPKVFLSGRNLSPRHFEFHTEYFHPVYTALLEWGGDQIRFLNNSQAGANDYADWLSIPREKIRVIRNGIHLAENVSLMPTHAGAFRLRYGIPASAPIVGGMFRFNSEKQPLLWLEAAGRIALKLPDAHFVIFGDGPMRHEMEKTVRRLGIKERTHFCGFITPAVHGLSACNVILLTSSGEGTPNVLLEAQSLGLPVVTTDAGGAAEAVLDGITGIVVKDRNPDEIGRAVVGILRDVKFRDAARREGPVFITARYGIDRMVQETVAAYQGSATQNRKRETVQVWK
jgi:glycosyltransferase involved in cell wall biosynthesis